MTIHLDKIPAYVPRVRKADGTIEHVHCDGAYFHVISYSTTGQHCTERDCEINKYTDDGAIGSGG